MIDFFSWKWGTISIAIHISVSRSEEWKNVQNKKKNIWVSFFTSRPVSTRFTVGLQTCQTASLRSWRLPPSQPWLSNIQSSRPTLRIWFYCKVFEKTVTSDDDVMHQNLSASVRWRLSEIVIQSFSSENFNVFVFVLFLPSIAFLKGPIFYFSFPTRHTQKCGVVDQNRSHVRPSCSDESGMRLQNVSSKTV